MGHPTSRIVLDRFDAWLFDLDGVLTATAKIHATSWKRMFDEYLKQRSEVTGEPFEPFEIDPDYRLYVDGKPRLDGIRDFLASREIALSEGESDDPPDVATVNGLGNWKNAMVLQAIDDGLVERFDSSIAFVEALREAGVKTAVVSSSRNCEAILRAAGIEELFDVRVDGVVASELGLPGKPAPNTFQHAADELGVDHKRAVVVEDAVSGVQAGRAGDFGLVVGVARKGNDDELLDEGADIAVPDLGELLR